MKDDPKTRISGDFSLHVSSQCAIFDENMHGRIITANASQPQNPDHVINAICPGCGHKARFDHFGIHDLRIADRTGKAFVVCLRRCPDPECNCLLYAIVDAITAKTVITYPFLRIDFDSTNIPAPVTSALSEAITCHANGCYIASAIMVRKTLELLCAEKNADGDNLKARIASLSSIAILPKDLFQGMDELRLLGNDAAHIESQVFSTIGQEEVEVAIQFTKEILKAVYQYSALLARLKSLKKT